MLDRLLTWRRSRGVRREHADRLYAAVVRQARTPALYRACGVADTVDGRFDLLALHAFLVFERLAKLPPKGPRLAQEVFDLMFADMDRNLREMGVSDMRVGKEVKKMGRAFYGRTSAYREALEAGGGTHLVKALEDHLYRGTPGGAGAERLAGYVEACAERLATQDLAALVGEGPAFAEPPSDPDKETRDEASPSRADA